MSRLVKKGQTPYWRNGGSVRSGGDCTNRKMVPSSENSTGAVVYR
jgi:hypothetical protein